MKSGNFLTLGSYCRLVWPSFARLRCISRCHAGRTDNRFRIIRRQNEDFIQCFRGCENRSCRLRASLRPHGASQPAREPNLDSICRLLVENSSEIIFWTDESGRILGANQATCQFWVIPSKIKTGMLSQTLIRKSLRQSSTTPRDLSVDHRLRYSPSPVGKMVRNWQWSLLIKRIEIDEQVYLYAYGREIVLKNIFVTEC